MAKFYASFGSTQTGLGTVGYEQVNGATSVVARTTVGVVEVGGGVYMVDVTLVTPTTGLLWDTGAGIFAFEDYKADLIIKLLRNRRETNPITGIQTLYDDDGTTPLLTGAIWQDVGGTIQYAGDGIDRQDPIV